jgi:hypothetical protein
MNPKYIYQRGKHTLWAEKEAEERVDSKEDKIEYCL